MNIEKVDIVGWRDGGIIGMDIEMRYKERMKSILEKDENV